MERLAIEIRRILAGKSKVGTTPALWDGHAADRIADTLLLPRGGTLAVTAS